MNRGRRIAANITAEWWIAKIIANFAAFECYWMQYNLFIHLLIINQE